VGCTSKIKEAERMYELDFPMVGIAQAQSGRTTTKEELESPGLVAATQLWREGLLAARNILAGRGRTTSDASRVRP
jgi:hypothetical protein